MEKYYEIENFDSQFESLDDAIGMLNKILDDESNYNYFANKNNTYAVLKVQYNSENDDYVYSEIIPAISISEYKDMDYEQKHKLFNPNK